MALAWVESWDDELRQFLVAFGEEPPSHSETEAVDDSDFSLTSDRMGRKRQVEAREGQQRLKFRVLQRHGSSCAVCGIDVVAVLDAAHLRPRRRRGSDHPGNGLVMCATHHRAQEAGLLGIEPGSTRLVASIGTTLAELGISHASLSHLPAAPHEEALNWLRSNWKSRPKTD
ncbi:MAG: hypothetical protein CME05_12525 [Gemmatimonadaceae bacterium]|nr:hypothetical protein [Gemmatimonadaceae bacterium]